jgi:hypothetical protein
MKICIVSDFMYVLGTPCFITSNPKQNESFVQRDSWGDVFGWVEDFFLGGGGQGKRNSRTRTTESFSEDDTSLQTDPRGPGQTRTLLKFRQPRRPLPHIEDSEGSVTPRSTTDSTEQWAWCFMYMWFMLHVISVICLV